MKKMIIILTYGVSSMMLGQVGINTETPHASSDLELGSSNKALYLNRVEDPENNISSPQNGMILYDITKKCIRAYQADAWSNCLGLPVENGGTVLTLECSSAIHSGILMYNGTEYNSGIETSVPYSGGNGGSYSTVEINSTGVTGLVARLQPGTFNNGSGNLVLQITGTPSGTGNAVFTLNLGGKSCSFTRIVEPSSPTVGTVTSLDCSAKLDPANLFVGQNYSGMLKISYTGGNGGSYDADTFTVKGLTFTRNAGSFSLGNGEIVYTVSGIPSSTGTISLSEMNVGGQTCSSMIVGMITGFTLYCGTGSYQPILAPGTLTAGQSYAGTYTIKYFTNSGGFYDGATYPSESFTVNGLTFSRSAGTFTAGVVSDVVYSVTGTPTNVGDMSITVHLANQSCAVTRNIEGTTGSVSNLRCSTAYHSGEIVNGTNYTGNSISTTIEYTGGNGGSYSGMTVSSTGVTGLIATLEAGTLNVGSGLVTFKITGTPSQSGIATFTITIGGKACSFTRTVDSISASGTVTSCRLNMILGVEPIRVGTHTNRNTVRIAYDGGNGGTYSGQNVNAQGVNGLQAVSESGTFNNGSGIVAYRIVGTPTNAGNAVFNLNLGGSNCSFSMAASNP